MAQTRVWKVAAAAAVLVAVASLGVAAGAERAQPQVGNGAGPTPRAGAASPTESTFVPIVPCRIANTQNGQPLGVGELRGFAMHGDTRPQGGAAACGIPTYATALEINVTAVRSEGNGYLRLGPTDAATPNATFLNYTSGVNLSNAGTVAVESGAGLNLQVRAFVRPTHVVIDVLGYYVSELFALVDEGGNLVASNGAVAIAEDIITGVYTVQFDRDVSGCGFAATPVLISADRPSTIRVTPGLAGADSVSVELVSGDTYTDGWFSLIVDC